MPEPEAPQQVFVPDIAVRQIGALTLQLAAAQEEIAQLRAALAAMAKEKEPAPDKES